MIMTRESGIALKMTYDMPRDQNGRDQNRFRDHG